MSISLRRVLRHDGSIDPALANSNFEDIARLAIGFGGLSPEIRVGRSTVTFTASTVSAAKTISHGMARSGVAVAPSYVYTQIKGALGFAIEYSAPTTSTFTVQGWTTGATTATVTFDWIAIG